MFRSIPEEVLGVEDESFGGHAVIDIEVGGYFEDGQDYLPQFVLKSVLVIYTLVDIVHDGPNVFNVIVRGYLLVDHANDLLSIGADGYLIYLCSYIAEGLELAPIELDGGWKDVEG